MEKENSFRYLLFLLLAIFNVLIAVVWKREHIDELWWCEWDKYLAIYIPFFLEYKKKEGKAAFSENQEQNFLKTNSVIRVRFLCLHLKKLYFVFF